MIEKIAALCAWYIAPALVMVILATLHAGAADRESSYAQWKNGLSRDPGYFPLAVWLQAPENAPRYREAGINLYIGLWQGPTREQIDELNQRVRHRLVRHLPGAPQQPGDQRESLVRPQGGGQSPGVVP